MDTSKIRIAMIGAGGMANGVHYPSLDSFDDVEIAAVCDLNQERLNSTADTYKIEKRYDNYVRMIEDTTPDGVYVIGPPHYMYDIWTWCLNQGLNLYIEKPMGLSVHQARSLAELADRNNCITQVSFQRRSCPMVVMLREKCIERGPITHAICTFYKKDGPTFGMRDRMMDDGVHAIDTIRWMCGGEVEKIDSIAKSVLYHDINLIMALLHFDNGSVGILQNSWTSGRRIFRVEMHAPNICAEAEHEGKGYLYADGDYNGTEYDTREIAGSDQNFIYGGFQAKNRNFIDCIKSGEQPESNFSDAVKTMEIADKILAKSLLEE